MHGYCIVSMLNGNDVKTNISISIVLSPNDGVAHTWHNILKWICITLRLSHCVRCLHVFYFHGFRRSVLEQHKSNGLDYMGPIKPSLAICVFSVFVLVYFSLWKGVRSAGKVVWVTALAPYVVLIFLLIRGVTLPGAAEGIRYYLTPQWHKLKNSKVCPFAILII